MATEMEIVGFTPDIGIYNGSKYGFSVCLEDRSSVRVSPDYYLLMDLKKPYLINPSNVECVVGEWNKDKTEYGIRIFFVSGNNVWCGGDTARKCLDGLGGFRAVEKFDAASKR